MAEFKGFDSFTRRGRGDFKSFGKGRRTDFFVPKLPEPEEATTGDTVEDRIFYQVRDRSLAKRVSKLTRKYPNGSVPELVAMDWLDRRNVPYQYQVPFAGGRSVRGGAILDFVLRRQGGVIVWRIQGDYHHGKFLQEAFDKEQRLALQRSKVQGQDVRSVVDIWTRRVIDRSLREDTLKDALIGIERGR